MCILLNCFYTFKLLAMNKCLKQKHRVVRIGTYLMLRLHHCYIYGAWFVVINCRLVYLYLRTRAKRTVWFTELYMPPDEVVGRSW